MPNQIGDRPDRAMARLLRDHYLSFKEIFLESGKQQDSIAVWLVGMSTGSIALIISQFGKLSPNLYAALKWSVGFLTGNNYTWLVIQDISPVDAKTKTDIICRG